MLAVLDEQPLEQPSLSGRLIRPAQPGPDGGLVELNHGLLHRDDRLQRDYVR